jgi:sugar (pentulose or hexulose) kinase
MENTVIGIDLSTTTAKAIAWDRTGRAIAEGRAPLTLERPEPNVYEQHPDAWWRAVQTALTGVLAQVPAESVAAIAIANQRETVAVTDAEDTPLRPAILWLDERRKAEVAALSVKVGADRLHALTGKPLDWAPAVYSLAWLARAEPDLFGRIAHVYDPHAWIVRRLTGEFATSWASADPLGAFDIVDHQWADPVIQALPLASEKFPTASAPGTIIGQVIPSAAAMTGLRASTPVVSGGGDGQAGGLGVGVAGAGTAYLNLGTAVVSGVYDREPQIDPAFRTMCAIDRGGYILETSLRSGTLLVNSLIRRIFGLDPDADPGIFRRLELEAAACPPGSGGLLLLPYWNGVMNPYWDQDARGCLLGLSPDHGRGEIYRAMLEGIALEQAFATNRVAAATGAPVESFIAIGGGSASDLWCRIMADITARPVIRAETAEASSLGAGIAAAVGIGWYGSFAEAASAMTRTGADFEPDPSLADFHAELLGLYADLYPRLRDLYPRLARLSRR